MSHDEAIRITVVMGSRAPVLRQINDEFAGEGLNIALSVFSPRDMLRPDRRDRCLQTLETSDINLVFAKEEGWPELEAQVTRLAKSIPTIVLGHDTGLWMLSSVNSEVVVQTNAYLSMSGKDNLKNMVKYICNALKGCQFDIEPVKEVPWEGLYHPDANETFADINSYLAWYEAAKAHLAGAPKVGLLTYRSYWVSNNLEVEKKLINVLENHGIGVVPVFGSTKDSNLGNRGSGEVIREWFFRDGNAIIDAFINLQSFFLSEMKSEGSRSRSGTVTDSGITLLQALDVPVFHPVVDFYKTEEEWRESGHGLGSLVGWMVAIPEFEGVIEPVIIGMPSREDNEILVPVEERINKTIARVIRWIDLRRKPVSERKVAFILHNRECASVEATVGAATLLDVPESLVHIMAAMERKGYAIEDMPRDGNDLIENIMRRKAVSEFRWTSVEEIVAKGGALKLVENAEYLEWFEKLPQKVQQDICKTWGNPPGEPMGDMPAAMVYEGKIVVTGVLYGNVAVCVQPKRGCAGARCDGVVCKILHDPVVPPPHQYLATYRYLESDFQADIIVHVGTHGNIEFLPGKAVGLSDACYPDMNIGSLPHLYIYNTNNPCEGATAKRRTYAALIGHMQPVMKGVELYGELLELEREMDEHRETSRVNTTKTHMLQHSIIDRIKKLNLEQQVEMAQLDTHADFDVLLEKTRKALVVLKETSISDGLHIIGKALTKQQKCEMIFGILKFDFAFDNKKSIRNTMLALIGLDYRNVLANPHTFDSSLGMTYSALLDSVNMMCQKLIYEFCFGAGRNTRQVTLEIMGNMLREEKPLPELDYYRERVLDILRRIEQSEEVSSLLHGLDGRYITPGPSGLVTRGRDDVLPTGRNFYSLDPSRIPSRAAYYVGEQLAEALVERYRQENGAIPESVAIVWRAADVMRADGETMGQILRLIGVKPCWLPNGQVRGFEIIPLDSLGRPRIDVTVRASWMERDIFPDSLELVDEAIRTVAELNEDVEMNFIKKHVEVQLAQHGELDRQSAMTRVFSSKPGSYSPGVNFAVYASAWKDLDDLGNIFLYFNGYAYGKGIFGQEMYKQLQSNLKEVQVVTTNTPSDEEDVDLLGCCCRFGALGGMTSAAKMLSPHEVKTYHGDTRDPANARVTDLADEIERIVRTKLLNPEWIETRKRHGYAGAQEMSLRVGRVYGFSATTGKVAPWIFDEIAKTFILDEDMSHWFAENNPWAFEEIARRLLEANERELWPADNQIIERIKQNYIELEGIMEEDIGDVSGDYQGGSIDIFSSEDVSPWQDNIKEMLRKLNQS